MTSWRDSRDLPPALSSMWRLCRLGYRHEPRLMLTAFALSQLSALPDALLALWIKLLGDGVLGGKPRLVVGAAMSLGMREDFGLPIAAVLALGVRVGSRRQVNSPQALAR